MLLSGGRIDEEDENVNRYMLLTLAALSLATAWRRGQIWKSRHNPAAVSEMTMNVEEGALWGTSHTQYSNMIHFLCVLSLTLSSSFWIVRVIFAQDGQASAKHVPSAMCLTNSMYSTMYQAGASRSACSYSVNEDTGFYCIACEDCYKSNDNSCGICC